jgi:hypothetical protein
VIFPVFVEDPDGDLVESVGFVGSGEDDAEVCGAG